MVHIFIFQALTGFILVILLLIFDISGRYAMTITGYFKNNETSLKRKCENCVWARRFKTYTDLYKGGRELSLEMLENITVLSENQCRQQKFLVYRCDSTKPCGGWADRQKGIVTTFLMALLTNRKFVIDVTHPCKLEEFLMPNVYNWMLCKNFLKNVPQRNISSFSFIERYKFNKEIKNFDFEGKWTTKVVVIRFNSYGINGIREHKKARERLRWILNMTNEEVIHTVLNTLFKHKDRLINDIIHFYNNNIEGRKLVCCHIRKGGNPSIPRDNKFGSKSPNETVIFDFLKQYDQSSEHAIYIAADSDKVKESARRNFTSYINVNRTIVHVDRLGKFRNLKKEACNGFYTAILEQFILSLCDKLLLTPSGFGTIAAYMRGISDNLYIYHPVSKRIVTANITDIQKIYKFL